MSKKIKADMGKLEEIQTILENNAKKITHNITRIGELHKEIDVCWKVKCGIPAIRHIVI